MKWNKRKREVEFSKRDISVIGQCSGSIDELLKDKKTKHPLLPPLWSVLSYVMLKSRSNVAAYFWQEYRNIRELAKNADKEYYRQATITKKTKGTRKIAVPDFQLMNQQNFIKREILDNIPVSAHAYAYKKGCNIKDCALPHVNQQTLIHMDIKDFFSSITEQMVFEALKRETGYSNQLVGLLSKLCCYKNALPQGTGTSPVLSNICFLPCDEMLADYAKENNLIYTRYSDDLFFSGSVDDAGKIIHDIAAILEKHGFRVNNEKTRVLNKNSSQRVVGLVVNEKMQVSRKYRRTLRQELYYLYKFREDAHGAKGKDYLTYLYKLRGKIDFVLSVSPDDAEFKDDKSHINKIILEFESKNGGLYRRGNICGWQA